MNKDYLKQYIANYGGVEVIKDIAAIMQELSQEWSEAGNKALGHTFSDTSFTLADVAYKLEAAQDTYANQDTPALDYKKYQLEFNKLMYYFQSLSIKDLQKAYTKNKEELIAKLKRLEFLKKLLNIKMSKNKHKDQWYLQFLAAKFGSWLYSFAYTFYCIVGNFMLVNVIYWQKM